jgi:hypothetical protein
MLYALVLLALVSPVIGYLFVYIPNQRKNIERLALKLDASLSPPAGIRLFGTVSGLYRGRKVEIYAAGYGGRGSGASTEVRVEMRYSGLPFDESTKVLIETLLACEKFILPAEISFLPKGRLAFSGTTLTWIRSSHFTNPEQLEAALKCLAPLADLFERTPNAYAIASERLGNSEGMSL